MRSHSLVASQFKEIPSTLTPFPSHPSPGSWGPSRVTVPKQCSGTWSFPCAAASVMAPKSRDRGISESPSPLLPLPPGAWLCSSIGACCLALRHPGPRVSCRCPGPLSPAGSLPHTSARATPLPPPSAARTNRTWGGASGRTRPGPSWAVMRSWLGPGPWPGPGLGLGPGAGSHNEGTGCSVLKEAEGPGG